MHLLEAVYRCDNCGNLSLATVGAGDRLVNLHGGNIEAAMDALDSALSWIPSQGDQPPDFVDVPDHIRSAAHEAYRCRSINAHRAAVLLARSVIEATAKENGITGGTLAQKINEMRTRDLIREHVKKAADEVRYLGNDMAHGDFVDPVDADDSELVLVLMRQVLREVFQERAQVVRAAAKRLAKKGDAASAGVGDRIIHGDTT